MRHTLPVLLSLPLLAGCAQDDPDNIPLRGEWELVTEIDSATIDGMIFTVDMLPPEMTALQETRRECGEPMFNNRNTQEFALDWQASGACDFDTWEMDGARLSAAGRCEGVGGVEGFDPRFDVDLVQRADSYRMVVSMEGSMQDPQQGAHHMRFIAVQEGTRTGDC